MVSATLGVLVGLAGIEHGIFEILQGNRAPEGFMIDAIGPAQKIWEHGGEAAVTIVPNFLITGILAVLVGFAATAWSVAGVHKKHGAAVLMLLSAILWLVGGGFAPPIFFGIPASLAATRIGKPLNVWRRLLPESLRAPLSRIWLGSLVAFVLCFAVSVMIIITGWPLTVFLDADTAFQVLNVFAFSYLGLMILSIVAAFAHDVQVHDHEDVSNG
jgi:hypothetical protein